MPIALANRVAMQRLAESAGPDVDDPLIPRASVNSFFSRVLHPYSGRTGNQRLSHSGAKLRVPRSL